MDSIQFTKKEEVKEKNTNILLEIEKNKPQEGRKLPLQVTQNFLPYGEPSSVPDFVRFEREQEEKNRSTYVHKPHYDVLIPKYSRKKNRRGK